MAPRNNDPSTSYKRNYPAEDHEVRDLLPCLLHKKHKVVKLVKSQIRKIRREGFICDLPQLQEEVGKEEVLVMKYLDAAGVEQTNQAGARRGAQVPESRREQDDGGRGMAATREGSGRNFYCYLLLFLLIILLLVYLMVYISAGPLSNSMAHTPIPPGSFVRTEKPCFLEKKYLLRWSRPEVLE